MNTDRAYILEACMAFVCQTHSLNVNAGKRRLSVKKAKRQMIGMIEVSIQCLFWCGTVFVLLNGRFGAFVFVIVPATEHHFEVSNGGLPKTLVPGSFFLRWAVQTVRLRTSRILSIASAQGPMFESCAASVLLMFIFPLVRNKLQTAFA